LADLVEGKELTLPLLDKQSRPLKAGSTLLLCMRESGTWLADELGQDMELRLKARALESMDTFGKSDPK
jgi:hypothetical protein